jgi:hypothetical protein
MQSITDNNNELNSEETSISSATQVGMTERSNQIQAWISFLEDVSQSLLKVNSAAVNNDIAT